MTSAPSGSAPGSFALDALSPRALCAGAVGVGLLIVTSFLASSGEAEIPAAVLPRREGLRAAGASPERETTAAPARELPRADGARTQAPPHTTQPAEPTQATRAGSTQPDPRPGASAGGLARALVEGPAPDPSPFEGASGPPAPSAPLLLSAQATPTPRGLDLRWTLRNASSDPIYVFAVLSGLGAQHDAPDLERVYALRAGQTLVLSRKLWPTPPGWHVLLPELPFLIRLEPGEVRQGGFLLPPEVASQAPYQVGAGGEPGPVEGVAVEFGYLDPTLKILPPREVAPGLYRVSYALALQAQRLVRSESAPATLAVIH